MTQKIQSNEAGIATERRRFVRVQDALGLHVQRLVELPAAGQQGAAIADAPTAKCDKYDIEGYAEVRRDHPQVTQYINDLEERIRELLLDGENVPAKPTHKVSISAGGICFSSKQLYVPGELVSMMLTLFPSGRRIGTDAIIVAANEADEVMSADNPNYRAEFIRISDSDRAVLQEQVERMLNKRALFEE